MTVIMVLMVLALLAGPAAAERDYKPLPAQPEKGQAVHIRVYHQPYYTQSWSSSVMKNKEFWKKYLPPGSTVTFEVALQGALAVNAIVAGQAARGYGGGAPPPLRVERDREEGDIPGRWVHSLSQGRPFQTPSIPPPAPHRPPPPAHLEAV